MPEIALSCEIACEMRLIESVKTAWATVAAMLVVPEISTWLSPLRTPTPAVVVAKVWLE